MQGVFPLFIEGVLSEERLRAYRRYPGDTDVDAVLRYLWNTELSASFYAPLQHLEVALRNAMHEALTVKYGTEFWFDTPELLHAFQVEQVDKARRKIGLPVGYGAGKIIAELEFGFWTALLHKKYAPSLVPVLMKDAFRCVEKGCRTREFLSEALNKARMLRNRIFHHEPIWYFRDLPDQHMMILQLILWVSPSLFRIALLTDRFSCVYKAGTHPFHVGVLGMVLEPGDGLASGS